MNRERPPIRPAVALSEEQRLANLEELSPTPRPPEPDALLGGHGPDGPDADRPEDGLTADEDERLMELLIWERRHDAGALLGWVAHRYGGSLEWDAAGWWCDLGNPVRPWQGFGPDPRTAIARAILAATEAR